jgi:hypothetical protein
MNTPEIRSRSLGTKLTEAQYEAVLERTNGQSPSEWLRGVVEAILEHPPYQKPIEQAVLEELIAVRMVVLNFHAAAVAGHVLTLEKAGEHIAKADAVKVEKAKALLNGVAW